MKTTPVAIIFDYGCVLSLPQAADDVKNMANMLDTSVESFVPVLWKHRLAYDKAELSPVEYWNIVAGECSRTLTPAQIEAILEVDSRSWSRPHPVTPRWAKEFRAAGLRTAILSNMPTPIREYLDTQCSWLPEFDHRTFSCDVRSAKPMPEIYAYCLAGLRVTPGEALLLDDREENLRAAEELGIHTVLFTTAEDTACELEKRFSLPIPLPL
jgi:putative hydrolase of the HAD superfamily